MHGFESKPAPLSFPTYDMQFCKYSLLWVKPNYCHWWDMEKTQTNAVARILGKHATFPLHSAKTKRLAVLRTSSRRLWVLFKIMKIVCKGSQRVLINYSLRNVIYFHLFVWFYLFIVCVLGAHITQRQTDTVWHYTPTFTLLYIFLFHNIQKLVKWFCAFS